MRISGRTNRLLFSPYSLGIIAICACYLAPPISVALPENPTLTLLNASYDPTRELYQEINTAFARHWEKTSGSKVSINQSHGGSGKQARSVIDGLEADVLTLALAHDIDAVSQNSGLLSPDWATRLPFNSSPFYSTIVFLVRQGNPRNIRDWGDLIAPGIEVITPNPKTSGGARWNYLAAWGYALDRFGGDQLRAREFISQLFSRVPILDTGARAATTTFTSRGIGDVYISWENEATLALRQFSSAGLQVVYPSRSIVAETPVAVVDKIVTRHGTKEVAEAYLEFFYTPESQQIALRHGFRPRLQSVIDANPKAFPELKLFTIEEVFGGWKKAHETHFADGAIFDQIQSEL